MWPVIVGGGYNMTKKTSERKKDRTRDELIEDILFNRMFKSFENNDREEAFHYLYALKMWRKQ